MFSGLPNDTHETINQTLELAKELNTEYANFFVMMAYPGTKLREVAVERRYPLPEKWGQYGFFAPDALPMRNKNLTAEEILRFRDQAFDDYFRSERYQQLVLERFGPTVLKFLNGQVLTKKITRTRCT